MKTKQSGFTLLEVLVALAIFAIASTALIKNATQTVKQTSQLEDRTIAFWMAENQLNEIRSAPRDDNSYPSQGTDRSSAVMAGKEWELVVEIENTQNQDMRRVTVSVFQSSNLDAAVASLTGFIGRY